MSIAVCLLSFLIVFVPGFILLMRDHEKKSNAIYEKHRKELEHIISEHRARKNS